MAYLSGAPLVPCFIERIGPGRFQASGRATPIYRRDRPAARRGDAARRRRQFADALEARVRAHPEYWYHFYRYWDAQRDEYDGLG